jgi:hypothetical protein
VGKGGQGGGVECLALSWNFHKTYNTRNDLLLFLPNPTLKVPKCEIFYLRFSPFFFTINPLWIGNCGTGIKKFKIVSFYALFLRKYSSSSFNYGDVRMINRAPLDNEKKLGDNFFTGFCFFLI